MSKLPLFIELVIKQTCRRATHESDVFNKTISLHPNNLATVQPEKKIVYSLEFIKKLHERARDHIYTLLSVPEPLKVDKNGKPRSSFQYLVSPDFGEKERKFLLDFLVNVKTMSPPKATMWIDLQHYIQYVYRNFASPNPDPAGEAISSFFISEMRELVKYLIQEDESQLFLRIIALIREYCIYAQWNYSKGGDQAITKLFYYYEAMLSAAKNCASAFRDFEVLIYKHYSVCWIDFNTCLFIRYFFETDYVQLKIYQCLEFRDSPGDTPAMFGLLDDLKSLWEKEQKRLVKINEEAAIDDTTDFFYIEEAMINSHKKVLKCNFWVQRPKMKELDLRRFDHHIFRLVYDPMFHPAGPILDKHGQCICEECSVAKYKNFMNHTAEEITQMILTNTQRVTFCRRCEILVELDQYHVHINSHSLAEDHDSPDRMSNASSSSGSLIGDENTKDLPNLRHAFHNHFKRRNKKKNEMESTMEAFEKFLQLKRDDGETREEFLTKNMRNFIKIKKDIFNHNHSNDKMFDMFSSNPTLKKLEHEIKLKEMRKNGHKCDKLLRSQFKSGCEHHCRHEELSKPGPCPSLMGSLCEPYKPMLDPPKKCDCTYCESAASHAHKSNELRDRLRVRLHQRREKRTKEACKTQQNNNNNNNTANSLKLKTVISKVEERVPLPSSPTNIPPAPVVKSSDSSSSSALSGLSGLSARTRTPSTNGKHDDIHGLLNYIEGNSGLNKMELAQKKAAKKARQRLKKEEERRKAEEEQKKIEEELKKKEDERKRELARKKAEKEAAGQVLAKKTKKERQAERKQQEKAAKKAAAQPKTQILEETIPAMVTIKRVAEGTDSAPTVTITLKGSTPDQEKLLYNLVKGPEDCSLENENQDKNKKKKKQKQKSQPTVVTKELQVTVALDQNKPKPVEDPNVKKLAKNNHVKYVPTKVPPHKQKEPAKSNVDLPIPMFRLPPGITITKVEGPITNRNYPVTTTDEKKATPSTNAAKSGVIVVDTEKLIQNKQSSDVPGKAGKNKKNKKKKKKQQEQNGVVTVPHENNDGKMITLKNPIFQSFRAKNEPPVDKSNDSCAPAAIFTNENGMVTIRSSRLQQSLMNGNASKPLPKLLSEIQPPKVKLPSSTLLEDKHDISPFNAQEILSGLPGIEITKVDKTIIKPESDINKTHPTAQVSIIPTNGVDKFDFDKDDWLYDNVFKPRDVLEDDMDPDELELEAFKRFCQQSVPPPVKDKVAHLNVAELVLKKNYV